MTAVTGAAGFIGSNLAARLMALDTELILVDHPLVPAKRANGSGFNHFRFMEHLDFLAEPENNRIAPDVIFHLGACSNTTETKWEYLLSNNVEYSRRLWLWCVREGRTLIYASSAATYGDGSQGSDDTIRPDLLQPLNAYGRSKNEFNIWVHKQTVLGKPEPSWIWFIPYFPA